MQNSNNLVVDDITVVIPFSGEVAYLNAALHSILTQNPRPSTVIIVSDNIDTSEVPSSEWPSDCTWLHYSSPSGKGNRSAVRNMGIRAATTRFIFMMDEDVILADYFFTELIRRVGQLSDIDKAVIHGHLLNRKIDVTSKEVIDRQRTEGLLKLPLEMQSKSSISLSHWTSFCTGNLFVSKALLDTAGLFDENIVGWGEEDSELGFRVHKCGGAFYSFPSLKGFHIIRPGLDMHRRERNRSWAKNLAYTLEKHKNESEYVAKRKNTLNFARRYS